jgi:hypothetical protein
VTIRVPKRLIEFLEEQYYFGLRKEEFFEVAIRGHISGEIGCMDIDQATKLQNHMKTKYGENFGLVYLPPWKPSG